MLLSWEAGEIHGPPLKNEPILEFKDSLIDLGRFYSYLQSLPVKERARKLKKQRKFFANIVPP